MRRRIIRAWHRDRRRVLFAAALFGLATVLAFGRVPTPVPWLRGEVFALFVVVLGITSVSLFLPKLRFLIEDVAIAGVVFQGLGLVFRDTNLNTGNPDGDLIASFVLFFLTVLLVHLFTYGRWSDSVFPRVKVRYVSRSRSRASLRDLWYGLMPTPGHLEACPDPDVVSIDYLDPSHKTIRLITWLPGRNTGETHLHIEEMEPLSHVRVRIEVIHGRRDLLMPGMTQYRLTDKGSYRSIYVSHEMQGLPLRKALRGWLDDTLGRFVDVRLRAVECGVETRANALTKGQRSTYDYSALTNTNPGDGRRKRGGQTAPRSGPPRRIRAKASRPNAPLSGPGARPASAAPRR